MNSRYIFVISLLVLLVILVIIKVYKNISFEKFDNIKTSSKTTIVKFTQPKQTDVLNITTSDGKQHNGAIAYKVNGSVPEYQKFPIETEQCKKTYNTTTQQQYIISYLYSGKLDFTSDKIDSNVYLDFNSKQNWNIILADNGTTDCSVYIASNTNDIALNPPYYLEVEQPENKGLIKKIRNITVNLPGYIKNNIKGVSGNYINELTPSLKVTTIKNDINSLWLIEYVDGIKLLNSDFTNILTVAFEFLEFVLKVAHDERKQFIETMIGILKPVAEKSSSIDIFISQLDHTIPNNSQLSTFGISGNINGITPHDFIVNILTDKIKPLNGLYKIKSVPFNLYLSANKNGGGIKRGSVTLSRNGDSFDCYWMLKPTTGSENMPLIEGFDVANFIKNVSSKKSSYKPVLASDSYPTIPNPNGEVSAGWDSKYSDAWNGNYIYRGTSLDNPNELIKVNLNNKNGIHGGRGTITVGKNIYYVKHLTDTDLIADSKSTNDQLRAKLVSGTDINKGRPVMVFLINGENICGDDSENKNQYCSKIDSDKVNNYQDQYQAAGIKILDIKNGLGIPQTVLNATDPNPCTNQNNNPITKECAQFIYYGKAYKPNSDQWKENSCTNQSFFENTLWSDIQDKDLAYAKDKIKLIQKRSVGKNPDPKYLNYCKGDTLGKLNNKFVKSKDGKNVYYIYNGLAYQIPSPGACFPGDHSSSEVITLTDDQLNSVNQFKSSLLATPASKNSNVAAACIVRSTNGKAVAASDKNTGTIFIVYNGKKYWLPKYGDCGELSDQNNVVRSYKNYNFSETAINAIPSVSNNNPNKILTGNSSNIEYHKNMSTATVKSSDPNIATYCKKHIDNQNSKPYSKMKDGYLDGFPGSLPHSNYFFTGPTMIQDAMEACNDLNCGGITLSPDGKSVSVRKNSQVINKNTGEKSWVRNKNWLYAGRDRQNIELNGDSELAYGTISGIANGPGNEIANGKMIYNNINKGGICYRNLVNKKDPDYGIWKSCFIKQKQLMYLLIQNTKGDQFNETNINNYLKKLESLTKTSVKVSDYNTISWSGNGISSNGIYGLVKKNGKYININLLGAKNNPHFLINNKNSSNYLWITLTYYLEDIKTILEKLGLAVEILLPYYDHYYKVIFANGREYFKVTGSLSLRENLGTDFNNAMNKCLNDNFCLGITLKNGHYWKGTRAFVNADYVNRGVKGTTTWLKNPYLKN